MMKKNFPLSVIIVSLSFLSFSTSFALPEYLEGSELQTHPKLTQGTLDNGVTYFLLPNEKPESKISLRLYVGAGSMDEVADQQGVAHFLEHMLFDGSKTFQPGEMIPHLQNMGMTFGQHVNAYTGFDRTVYMLDLPDTEDETLDTCFNILHDYVNGALLDADELEKERGVILAEKISRDSISRRLFTQKINLLMPESMLPKRFPIGIEEVIKNIPRQRMVDFYENYYSSHNIAVVAVGDLEPEKMESLVKKHFSNIPEKHPKRNQNYGQVPALDKAHYKVLFDGELDRTSIDFTNVQPYQYQIENKENAAQALTYALINQIITTRLQEIAEQEGSPIISGYAYQDILANHARYNTISVSTSPELWTCLLYTSDAADD